MSLSLSVMKSNMSRYILYNFIFIWYAFVETVDHWCNFRRPEALIYPYQAGLFSHLPGPGMGGGGGGEEGLRGLDAKRQDYHQPIKTKFCIAEIGFLMQNLSLIVVPFTLGMMSKYFLLKKGKSDWIGIFTPENGFNFQKWVYVQNRPFRPKISPYVNFSKFQAQEIFFHIKNILDISMRKSSRNPWLTNFARVCSKHIFGIKPEIHEVWAS